MKQQDTIIALATAQGKAAIAVIRLSGQDAIRIANQVFDGGDLEKAKSHTVHFGTIRDHGEVIDEVLVSVFRSPHSFTKEDSVEISTHGSNFIVQKVIQLCLNLGVRYAKAGEFTQRAFLNGRFDLAQAEAVADLIAADSEAAHQAAMHQMRGGFSDEIKKLRQQLLDFCSLIELELDFSEEDVNFASRLDLKGLVVKIINVLESLIQSFQWGNVMKEGVPIVIAGKPNAGKSTLLNSLLNEEKAIVSAVAGTTRDIIEDEIIIEGISFRFIDTAGLRKTTDEVEAIGVHKAKEKMKAAALILYVFDATDIKTYHDYTIHLKAVKEYNIPFIMVGNKVDDTPEDIANMLAGYSEVCLISAKADIHIDKLKREIIRIVNLPNFKSGDTIVTNLRHYQSLLAAKLALQDVLNGLEEASTTELIAFDIRNALYHLGEITGEVTSDEILGNIFSKFCIGK